MSMLLNTCHLIAWWNYGRKSCRMYVWPSEHVLGSYVALHTKSLPTSDITTWMCLWHRNAKCAGSDASRISITHTVCRTLQHVQKVHATKHCTPGSQTVLQGMLHPFLANVNSCSCLLYVIVRPSVCHPSVCRLSVTFVHPTQPIEIFGNVSVPFNMLVT